MNPFHKAKSKEELYKNLNEEFFNNYDNEYFSSKAIILGGLLTKEEQIVALISEGYEVGKIKVGGMQREDIKWMSKYSKQEIVINSYHCVESFFRLLIAHCEYPESPWLGIVEQNEAEKFKKKVKKIADQEYFNIDHGEAIAELMIGKRTTYKQLSDEEWKMNLSNAVDLVERLSKYLLNTPDYNVFKHGASLFKTEFGMDIGPFHIPKQEAFIYLGTDIEKTETQKIEHHFKAYKFMKWELAFANTFMASHLLTNMLNIKKAQLGYLKEIGLHSFHTYDLHQMLETGIITDVIKIPLVSNTYERKPKTKQ